MSKQKQERIKVRWTPGWTAIPNTIIRDTSVSRNARLLWCLIASYAGNDESAWPSQESLAEAMGDQSTPVTRQSIHRWTVELWRAGWITIIRTATGHEYELHEPTSTIKAERAEQKSPFDTATDVTPRLPRCNTTVTSDVTPELLPTISIDLKTKTHHQESRGACAPGGGGAVAEKETPTSLYLRDVAGSKSPKARQSVGHLPLDLVRARWEAWQRENPGVGVGAFILDLRDNPAAQAAPAQAEPIPPWADLDAYNRMTDTQKIDAEATYRSAQRKYNANKPGATR